MIISNFLIGFVEDNMGFFVISTLVSRLPGCTDYIGFPTGYCFGSLVNNQPVISILSYVLARLSNPVAAYNLIVLGGMALNYFFSFRFFKKIFGRFIALLLATVFIANPYLAYQSRSHFDLMQFWPVIWFLDTLFFSKSMHKNIYLGLLLTLLMGVSNYLCYFTVLFAAIYLVFKLLLSKSKISDVKSYWRGVVKTLAVFILLSSTFIAPYVKSNFFSTRIRIEENINSAAVNRPFEDFIVFSSRPWYYLLPSVDNPFFGELSQKFLNQLSNGRNYLTQNYFKAEHSASYLGWMNLILALVGVVWLFRVKRETSQVNYPALLITIIGLIILTMPPSITLKGVTIYTPSNILFKTFPMFRVLARAGVLILFSTLIFTGYGYRSLINLSISTKIKRKVVQLVLSVMALFSISEFFIPLKITHVGTPPKVYTYLGATEQLKAPIVVYPYSKTNEVLFWTNIYKQPLINPHSYENKETGFVSTDFTNLLKSSGGLEKAHNMGARYLVYFYGDDDVQSMNFFNQSQYLIKIDNFKEENQGERQITISPIEPLTFTFIRIVEAGTAESNSAVLYKFR